MKKFLFIFFVFPLIFHSQSREYKRKISSSSFKFLTDSYKILDNTPANVISAGVKLGYELVRGDSGNIIYDGGVSNFFILQKRVNDDSYFPNYAVGNIVKKIFFMGDDLEEGIIMNSITEIGLIQYSNVSTKQINNFHDSTRGFIREFLNYNYKSISNSRTFEKPLYYLYFDSKYTYGDIINFNYSQSNDYEENGLFTVATRSERKQMNDGSFSTFYYLGFEVGNSNWKFHKDLIEMSASSSKGKSKALQGLRNNIGDKNLEEINVYDLKAMVQFFLDDCKRSNIEVPEIETLSATFEPLDGAIALAYGMNNDDSIIIKVDPMSWANASIQKKWYILYHELGHDVLNLNHGEGGKMMFNFADREYSWDEFYQDKDYMFSFVAER